MTEVRFKLDGATARREGVREFRVLAEDAALVRGILERHDADHFQVDKQGCPVLFTRDKRAINVARVLLGMQDPTTGQQLAPTRLAWQAGADRLDLRRDRLGCRPGRYAIGDFPAGTTRSGAKGRTAVANGRARTPARRARPSGDLADALAGAIRREVARQVAELLPAAVAAEVRRLVPGAIEEYFA